MFEHFIELVLFTKSSLVCLTKLGQTVNVRLNDPIVLNSECSLTTGNMCFEVNKHLSQSGGKKSA